MPEITLTIPCLLESLAFSSAAARGIAAERLGPDAGAFVEIAVTEVCSNIVRHGHPDDPAHRFTMTLRGVEHGLEVEIRDSGPAYSFKRVAMPSVDVPLDQLPEGGFGMAIVYDTMDAVEFTREGEVNIVRLLKRAGPDDGSTP